MFDYQLKPGDIFIQDIHVLRNIYERNYSPLLINILTYIAQQYGVCIVKAWQPKKHMKDLYGTQPCRANSIGFLYYESEKYAYEIKHDINSKWIYNHELQDKNCAEVLKCNKMHVIEIKVHPNTRRRLYDM